MSNPTVTAIQAETPYYTVPQFCQKHPAFTQGGMRHFIFFESQNGLANSGAIIRVGRKILIRENRFFDWLESQNQKAA